MPRGRKRKAEVEMTLPEKKKHLFNMLAFGGRFIEELSEVQLADQERSSYNKFMAQTMERLHYMRTIRFSIDRLDELYNELIEVMEQEKAEKKNEEEKTELPQDKGEK